jgi:hypothetical protein
MLSKLSTEAVAFLALIISVVDIVATVLFWFFNRYSKQRIERIRAHEEVYPDTCFILSFPLRKREEEAKAKRYCSKNLQLQKAVRAYIEADPMERFWNPSRFIPPELTGETPKKRFLQVVAKEARRFEEKLWAHRINLAEPELSPVFYLDNPEIKKRMTQIMEHVGKNLSLFGTQVRSAWEASRYKDPKDVRQEHQKNLQMCSRYYEFHPHDFDDPYYDLIKGISHEYHWLRKEWRERVTSTLLMPYWRLRHQIRSRFKSRRKRRR